MAGLITSLGAGSGLNLEALLKNLLAAESRPVKLLQARKAGIDLKISGFGQVKSALSQFQKAAGALSSADAFRRLTASSTDSTNAGGSTVFSATASQAAAPGSNVIQVMQLAGKHKSGSRGFASDSQAIGAGRLNFTAGGKNFSVDINSENNTLAKIRDAINAQANNSIVQAGIIKVDQGYKLILTARQSGAANQIVFSVTDNDGNSTDNAGLSKLVFGMQEIDKALDARLVVDGLAATRSSNKISDVIAGVSLDLKKTGTATLSVAENVTVAKASIEKLVSSYNSLASTLDAQAGRHLSGENTLLNIQTSIRDLFSRRYNHSSSGVNYLFQLGLNFDRKGVLGFDRKAFDKVIADNTDKVQSLFTDTKNGFIASLENIIKRYTDSDGIIINRTKGLDKEKTTIDNDIGRLELRLKSTEARLRKQFTDLDVLVSRLKTTSSFLTRQFQVLNQSTNTGRNL